MPELTICASLAGGRLGISKSTWTVPKDAKEGVYEVLMRDTLAGDSRARVSGSFRVEAFRVPTMKALIQPMQQAPVNADRVEVDIQVSYLSGGGAGNPPVKLRGLLQPKAVSFPDYEGFVFANGWVQEGVSRRPAPGPMAARTGRRPVARAARTVPGPSPSSRSA